VPVAPRTVLLLLLAAVAVAYWPVLDAGFIWDDDDYVTQNPVLREWGGILRIWLEPTSLPQYYPLVHTSFWLEYRCWGADPLGYHLVNALLHLGGSYALWLLLRRLRVPGALFGALLFAVHPVHVESVAWVTERKNVLSLACMLVAANCWLRWRDSGGRGRWWSATGWFLAALLSKTVTASLPAALLVVEWWRHGRLHRRDLRGTAVWFLLAILFGVMTAWLEATHVRAAGHDWQVQGADRLLVAGRAPWFYLGSLLWPFGLCFSYERWHLDGATFAQWLPLLAGCGALGVALLLRRWWGRGPLATLLLFGGMLVPALGFFDVYPFRFAFVADHFQYHADAAMLAGIAALCAIAVRSLPGRAVFGIAGTTVLALAVGASLQASDYRDLETLWRRTLQRNPDSMLAMVNLGGLLLDRGEVEEAEAIFRRCLDAHPGNYESLGNLGAIAHRRGDLVGARRLYESSLAERADSSSVLANLAQIDLLEGENRSALTHARQSVDCDPDGFAGHWTLARAAAAVLDWRMVLVETEWLLSRKPDAVDMRLLAAKARLETGDHVGAIRNAAVVLGRLPGMEDARHMLAEALAVHLGSLPADRSRGEVERICRSVGVDPGLLLPLVAAALIERGDRQRAGWLQR
jgi:tetratricopeptide (TPR) repeat protein